MWLGEEGHGTYGSLLERRGGRNDCRTVGVQHTYPVPGAVLPTR
jgi:hypothetical protein